jgi:hypothetical protein
MALTYTTLKQAVQDYLEETETSFVTHIDTSIYQAEDRIVNAVQLPFFRKNSIGSLTTGNEYLTLPSDYLSPYSVAVDNSGYEFLVMKDVSYIRSAYPDSTATGTPKHYGIFSETSLILGPTPDAAYAVELHYFFRPESIVTAETTWLGTNADSCLLYGTLVEAYTYLKGEPETMAVYVERYNEALAELKDLAEGYSQTDGYRGGTVRSGRQ